MRGREIVQEKKVGLEGEITLGEEVMEGNRSRSSPPSLIALVVPSTGQFPSLLPTRNLHITVSD